MTKLTRPMLAGLDRTSLHVARNSTKADVYRFEWPPASGEQVVLKDMGVRPAWFRLSAGRIFMLREYRALRALEGIEGIPSAIARPDADSLVMEWRPGKPIMKWGSGDVPVEALNRISAIIDEAHARGVIHGDLHRSNVLLSDDGQVTIIDWATAGVFGPARGALKSLTFKEWRSLDRRAVAKLKARHAPQSLTPEEIKLLGGSVVYRLIRNAGFRLRKFLGQQHVKSPELAIARYKELAESAQNHSSGGSKKN